MDQVKSDFYASQILEAVETIAAGIVSKIKFDQTILCTIINDEKKKDGIYEVSNGSSTFTATSGDTNYSKDMVVYVLIPQGDYENQKTIVGKYVDDSGSAVNYIPDSESIIEIVTFDKDTSPIENVKIIPPSDSDCWKLLANDRRDEEVNEQVISGITLFELPFENYKWNNTNVYTCASLKAKFKTNLSQYNILKGDYGLRLTLEGYKVNESGEAVLITGKPYIFSCADMYGDPYNYNTYYEHDIVFDLEEQFKDVKINNIKIEFYQDNNFIELNTSKGIPSTYSVKNNFTGDIETQLYSPNLFVKDISLSFGYTIETIKEEGIKIYTPDDLKYINRDDKKDILLKWFTKNQIGSKTAYGIVDEINEIPDINKNNLSIYWYRYVIDNSNPDPILGKGFWQLIPGATYQDGGYTYQQQQKMQYNYSTNKEEPVMDGKNPVMEDSEWIDYRLIENVEEGQYYIIEDPNGDEQKILRELGKEEYDIIKGFLAVIKDINKLPEGTKRYKALLEQPIYKTTGSLTEPFKYSGFGPNELLETEKIKAVLQIRSFEEVITEDEDDKDIKYIAFKGEQKIYESNELIFENKNPAEKNLAAVNLIRNMRLECADGSEGVYMIYNSTTNKIIDAQKNNNILNVYFDNYLTEDISKIGENCKITWRIPENSMIEPVNFTLNNQYLKANIDANGNIIEFIDKDSEEGSFVYIPEMKSDDIATIEETTSSNLISWNLNKETHYWECSYYWTGDESLETSDIIYENQYLPMHYGLNPFYTRSENNTIFCEIEKYGKVYKAELKMFFGSAGTSGTKYTLIAELEKEYGTGTEPSKEPTSNERVRYLTAEKPTGFNSWPWVKVIATLFDEHFKDISEKHKFSWSFKNNNQNSIEVYNNQTEGKEIYIRLKNNVDVNSDEVFDAFTLANYYCILEVITMQQKTTSDENGPIVALQYDLPIGVRIDTSIGEYTGTEKLIYDAQGRLPKDESFQELHVLRNFEAEEISNLTWSVELIDTSDDNILQYLPTFDYTDYKWEEDQEGKKKLTETKLTSNNILKPKELYFSNLADQCIVITARNSDNIIQFVQPIIYGQNKYGISMLNNWDGHQLIDAAGNKILTALVGAGLKNENNTFSGVFIGEIGQVGSEDSQTGLLGLHEGVHTFGFHTDGTAFIGPSGSGRINFDGTKSTISSGNYDEGKTGTLIDLDDGSVEINPNEILIEYETFETFFNNNKEANEYKVIEDAEQDFISEQISSARIQINSSTAPYFHIQGACKMKKDSTSDTGYDLLKLNDKEYLQFEYQSLIYIDNKDYFLQSLDYKESTIEYNKDIKDTSEQKFISLYTPGDGFRIDLANKEIQAYKFKLSAGENVPEVGNMVIEINSDSSHEVIKDENNEIKIKFTTYPLVIGDHFKVSWLGDINAINGIFEGNITASSGFIGGWTIGEGKLYYGWDEEPKGSVWDADNEKIILSPKGVFISGTVFTEKKVWDESSKEDGTIGFQSTPLSQIDNVVFNVGKNFVLQADGTLYLSGAQIGGYAHENDLSNMSQSLQNTITKLGNDLTVDFNTNIGKVNLEAEGSISYLGELNDNVIFLTEAYAGSSSFDGTIVLYEGYMSSDNSQFYENVLEYETPSFVMASGKYYQDLLINKYYLYDQDELIEIDSLPIGIEINKGYYDTKTKAFYPTINYEKSTNPKPPQSHTFDTHYYYFDIDNNKLYQYDNTNSKYILTNPDEVYLFSVSNKGLLQAQNAVISGTIFANAGHIGGWNIQRIQNAGVDGKSTVGSLTYGNTDATNNGSYNHPWVIDTVDANLTPGEGLLIKNKTLFGEDDSSNSKWCTLNIGQNFAVTTDGTLYANGEINASGGSLGGWKIGPDALLYQYNSLEEITSEGDNKNKAFIVPSGVELNGNNWVIAISGDFGVTVDGKLAASDAYLEGEIHSTRGKIGGWEIQSNRLYYNKLLNNESNTPSHYLGLGVITNPSVSGKVKYFKDTKILVKRIGNSDEQNNLNIGGVPFRDEDYSGFYFFRNNKNYAYVGYDSGMSDDNLYINISLSDFGADIALDDSNNLTINEIVYDIKSQEMIIINSQGEIVRYLDTTEWTRSLAKASTIDYISLQNIRHPEADSILGSETSESQKSLLFIEDIPEEFNYCTLQLLLECEEHTNLEEISYKFFTRGNQTVLQRLDTDKEYTTNDGTTIEDCINSFLNDLHYPSSGFIRSTTMATMLAVYTSCSTRGLEAYGPDSLNSVRKITLSGNPQSILWTKDNNILYSFGLNESSGLLNRDNLTDDLSLYINGQKKFIIKPDGNCIFNELNPAKSLGGFKLNGNIDSDIFWNNSLFTNNTVKTSTSKYAHYIGFMRSVGEKSSKLSNVFLGVKQIVNNNPSFPTSTNWSNSNASYNFCIKFNGEIYTNADITSKKNIISEGRIWTKSKNIDSNNELGSIVITGNNSVLTFDANMLYCLKNGSSSSTDKYGEANLYVKATALLPSNIVNLQDNTTTTPALGSYSKQWREINGITYTGETISNTSDLRLKDIQYTITKNQLLSIYNNLNPVAYKYKNLSQNENHSRTHYGFLAQEVEKIIENVGLTSEDFAAVQIVNLDEPIPGCEDGKKYYLNYNEFHGLHVLKNQEQDSRIQELENKVQELEQQILELRGKGV